MFDMRMRCPIFFHKFAAIEGRNFRLLNLRKVYITCYPLAMTWCFCMEKPRLLSSSCYMNRSDLELSLYDRHKRKVAHQELILEAEL